MTYTRTFTLEERACDAMCSNPPRKVQLDDGTQGIIVGLRREFPDLHSITVTFRSDGGSECEFTLKYEAIKYL